MCTLDPTLVQACSRLLNALVPDHPVLCSLYKTGVYYFGLMYTGSNITSFCRFLALTHNHQAFTGGEAADPTSCSILSPILPEAMIAYLKNHGPDKFAEVFLGEFDTPEVFLCAVAVFVLVFSMPEQLQ